jgi:hypothetical protein
LAEFKSIVYAHTESANRKWFNSVRMGATKAFGVDSILYLDCDADVLADVSPMVNAVTSAQIGAVLSPVMHVELGELASKLGWGAPEREWNNGLLWLQRDYTSDYEKAWDKAEASGVNRPRIPGTLAFNTMLHDLPVGEFVTVPSEYGVIWHDVASLGTARIVQYCNDFGQQKRLELEAEWIAAKT